MSDIQSMVFMQKLMKNYSGNTLKEQKLARKSRQVKIGDDIKRFAGILPEEQLRAMSPGNIGDLTSHFKKSTLMEKEHYIKEQYEKRNSLLEEVDINKIGNNQK